MAAVVYLETDDEITSAAARIRAAGENRVTLVVPYGSRLATSRINFRLLAREAVVRNHRLAIVAGDAATRALAASAGLPVYASVNEYEEANPPPPPPRTPPNAGSAAQADRAARARRRPPPAGGTARSEAADPARATPLVTPAIATGAGERGESEVEAAPDVADVPHVTDARARDDAREDDTLSMPADARAAARDASAAGVPGGARAIGAGVASAVAASAAGATAARASEPVPARRTSLPEDDAARNPYDGPTAGRAPEAAGGRRSIWPFSRTVTAIAAAVVALALLAGGVAAFLLLPSAEITVAVRTEQIGPIRIPVRADPAATEVNPAAAVIPAERLSWDLAVEDTFPATGVRVETAPATGRVTFLSKDAMSDNTIAAGAVVATPNGIRFRTTAAVTVPMATIVGLTIVPGEASVDIQAVEEGPDGNVEANAITVIPAGENPTFTEVRNDAPTTGGLAERFVQVRQQDVDAAVAELTARLEESFQARLGDPESVAEGVRLFPDTRRLGEPEPSVDPASFVGQEIEAFELGLSATGTVIGVDPAPVEALARERMTGAVGEGYRLVDGSIDVEMLEPVVEGEVVTFPVTASAQRVREVDEEQLATRVKGRAVDQARAILAEYGSVTIRVWPEWVATIPSNDGRVELRVETPSAASGASPAPPGSQTPGAPTSAPSGGVGGDQNASVRPSADAPASEPASP